MSVRDMLDGRDEFERQILSNYQNILDETFRFTYKVDGKVNWLRITRFSADSNFALISGVADLADSYDTEAIEGVEVSLDVIFTIPMKALDDGSTAEEISIMAQRISALSAIISVDEYYSILQNPTASMDTVNAIVDEYDDRGTIPNIELHDSDDDSIEFTIVDKSAEQFDLTDLTEKQRKALALAKQENVQ